MPTDLMPINMVNQEPMECILGTLGIYSRMNFGQISEAIISKAINKAENEILANSNNLRPNLLKFSQLASELGDEIYSQEILQLYNNHDNIQSNFIQSVKDAGLFFECPGFANINVKKLKHFVEESFNLKMAEPIRIKKETFKYMKQKLKCDLPLPKDDIIYPALFNSKIYMLKLMQLADSKITARDFGAYSMSTHQPTKDKVGTSTGSRLGKNIILLSINHLNCWNLLLGQSAAKPSYARIGSTTRVKTRTLK